MFSLLHPEVSLQSTLLEAVISTLDQIASDDETRFDVRICVYGWVGEEGDV